MAESSAPSSFLKSNLDIPKFELVKEIEKDVWLAVRQGDPHQRPYLARPFHTYHGLNESGNPEHSGAGEPNEGDWTTLLDGENQGGALAQILNHDNLVSLVGRIDIQPFSQIMEDDSRPGNRKTYLVWDFCDGGNLSTILNSHKPSRGPEYYLPESLCWHVLRSLIRAVVYLHDGIRLKQRPEKGTDPACNWLKSPDTDWLPILHRNIDPANIFFQQPRGGETYGKCKLGNFSHATVTGHVLPKSSEGSSVNNSRRDVALDIFRGHEPLQSLLTTKFTAAWASFPMNQRIYGLGHELWAIGSILTTMMTGSWPTVCCSECGYSHIARCTLRDCVHIGARGEGCECIYGGCRHQTDDDCGHPAFGRSNLCPPDHPCEKPIINIDTYITRSHYSIMLRCAVNELVVHDLESAHQLRSGFDTWMSIEREYLAWKTGTAEGREHRDLEDEMSERWEKRAAERGADGNMQVDNY
ncbi:kinase-like domain-containing protein [Mariannaea sp. PMI_226]|nr:kinase-like domain-containing protein [Mariannaea sp. PMI_226]